MLRQRTSKPSVWGSDSESAVVGGGSSSKSRRATRLAFALLPWVLVCVLGFQLFHSSPSSPPPPTQQLTALPLSHQQLMSPHSSRKCTPEQAQTQGEFASIARVRGCPGEDDIWLRFAQLIMPNAKTFIDIGSNKGFTAARLFELWSPELGLEAHALHSALKKTSPTNRELTECGACNDCRETGLGSFAPRLPRYCSPLAATSSDVNLQHTVATQASKFCQDRVSTFQPISVFSYDGSPQMIDGVIKARDYLAAGGGKMGDGVSKLKDVADVPEERLPAHPLKSFIAKSWNLQAAAFSSQYVPGQSMRFLVGSGETGHLLGDEEPIPDGFTVASVPVLTVDEVVSRHKLDHVDVLKIDTEGHDPLVLLGASNLLAKHQVTLVIFEYNKMWDFSHHTLYKVVHDRFGGYACYLEGKNLLLKLTHGCWSKAMEMKKWSNVWCVSPQTNQGLALSAVFDSYALAFV
ncbi:hypothetical protein BASA81_000782 [Batrachochytrium salamandrivorans]|nr:hypothetical protein BASA81_000782 [Batrachochytrium salamandrivorans]